MGAIEWLSTPGNSANIAHIGFMFMDYHKIITIEPGKRGGKPCIRGIRITVGDVLGWLAAGMTHQEIIDDYPDLTEEDIRACLAYEIGRASCRERVERSR